MNDGSPRPGLREFRAEAGPLAYRDHGTGEPLVLLHGGLLDHTMWEAQFARFARTHRVIAPDLRGHGATAPAGRPFRHTDELAALLRHLDCGPAVVAGLSWGSGIATDTALEHPELVRALVVSGAGTSEPEFRDPWTAAVLGGLRTALAAGDAAGGVERFLDFAAGPHRSLADVPPGVLDTLRATALRTLAGAAAAGGAQAVPVTRTWERLPAITVPVLAVNGGADSEDHLRLAGRLAREVANGRTAVVEGSGHYPNLERPDDFDAILAGFLAALPGTG
jgi:pimeloyl-ACP methyl ester carboxylesterase